MMALSPSCFTETSMGEPSPYLVALVRRLERACSILIWSQRPLMGPAVSNLRVQPANFKWSSKRSRVCLISSERSPCFLSRLSLPVVIREKLSRSLINICSLRVCSWATERELTNFSPENEAND